MKGDHFQRIRPICPVCRAAGRAPAPLELGGVAREVRGDVLEGVLLCPERMCRREYPIVDGIPILVADVRGYVGAQLGEIRARFDLSPFTETLLGDCAGPGSDFERNRYQLSSYGRDHFGDLDPEHPAAIGGGLIPLLDRALSLLPEPPAGRWLDAGCSVGRAAFALAARTGDLVLGVDLSFAMLRMARRVAVEGVVSHPLRRAGLVYDRREFEVDLPGRERVDFWAMDATALAIPESAVDGALSLNLLDCAWSPLSHLAELGRALRPGGHALLATPYDWSTNATPLEGWLGGHSQRSELEGDPASELRRLLAPGDPAEAGLGLELAAEADRVPWRVYVHERAHMSYEVHLAAARALAR